MNLKPFCATGLAALASCAQPATKVLAPYQLADGRAYQDVVTIAADGKGTSPTVTLVNTYALSDGPKGAGEIHVRPVATAYATGQGIVNEVVVGAVRGASGAVAGAVVSAAIRGNGTTINNSNTNISKSKAKSQSSDNSTTTTMTTPAPGENDNTVPEWYCNSFPAVCAGATPAPSGAELPETPDGYPSWLCVNFPEYCP